jgi:hypothetical protein
MGYITPNEALVLASANYTSQRIDDSQGIDNAVELLIRKGLASSPTTAVYLTDVGEAHLGSMLRKAGERMTDRALVQLLTLYVYGRPPQEISEVVLLSEGWMFWNPQAEGGPTYQITSGGRELITELCDLPTEGAEIITFTGNAAASPNRVPLDSINYLLQLVMGNDASVNPDLMQQPHIKLLEDRKLIALGVPAEPNSLYPPTCSPTDAGVKLAEKILQHAGKLRSYAPIRLLIELGDMRAHALTGVERLDSASKLTEAGYAYRPTPMRPTEAHAWQITSAGLGLLSRLFHVTAEGVPAPVDELRAASAIYLNVNQLHLLLSLDLAGKSTLDGKSLSVAMRTAAKGLQRRSLIEHDYINDRWVSTSDGSAHAERLRQLTQLSTLEMLALLAAHAAGFKIANASEQETVDRLVDAQLLVSPAVEGEYSTSSKGDLVVCCMKECRPTQQDRLSPPTPAPSAPEPVPLSQRDLKYLLTASADGEVRAESYEVQKLVQVGYLARSSEVRPNAHRLTNLGQAVIAKILHAASPDNQKPPLGLKPSWLFDEQLRERQEEFNDETRELIANRIAEIHKAIGRYIEQGKPVPEEWTDELNRRIKG